MSTSNPAGTLNEEAMNISLGRVTGISAVHKFGVNLAVGTTREDIWSLGGIYPWLQTERPVRIKAGGNAADTAAGNGARSVIVEGLDENWEVATETLVTAGASVSAATTTTFRRIIRAYVSTSGTYTGANTGAIIIESTAPNDLAEIQAGYGQTQMTMFTVPADKKALIYLPSITISAVQTGNARLLQRRNADIVAAPFTSPRIISEVNGFTGSREHLGGFPILLPEKTDVWADGASVASTASITVEYSIALVNV